MLDCVKKQTIVVLHLNGRYLYGRLLFGFNLLINIAILFLKIPFYFLLAGVTLGTGILKIF